MERFIAGTEVYAEVVGCAGSRLTLAVEVGRLVIIHQVSDGVLGIGLVGRDIVGSVLVAGLQGKLLVTLGESTYLGNERLGVVDESLHVSLGIDIYVIHLGDVPL